MILWRLLARIVVPRRAIEGAWPRPGITLWYFDHLLREAYLPTMRAELDRPPLLLRRLADNSGEAPR